MSTLTEERRLILQLKWDNSLNLSRIYRKSTIRKRLWFHLCNKQLVLFPCSSTELDPTKRLLQIMVCRPLSINQTDLRMVIKRKLRIMPFWI